MENYLRIACRLIIDPRIITCRVSCESKRITGFTINKTFYEIRDNQFISGDDFIRELIEEKKLTEICNN